MTLLRRATLLLLPLLLALAAISGPGRAQTSSSRFAFADTTLLRDTLGLHFDRLFPLADSLGMLPDTLRALSIRYRYSLDRLVLVADSLAIPVDSVGAMLERERYNPLAATGSQVTTFNYNSSYNVQQTSSGWTNGSDYNVIRGPLFLRNTTNIGLNRYRSVGRLSLQQSRVSTTESGYKFSKDFSLGGRLNLERYNNADPGNNFSSSNNDLQITARSRQAPGHGIISEVNLLSGVIDQTNALQIKRGISGDLNGRVRLSRGNWLSQDFAGQLAGNLARTRVPNTQFQLNTHDLTRVARGTLTVQPMPQAGLVVNFNLKDLLVETPQDSTRIQQIRTQNNGVDATARLRRDSDRYVNLTARDGSTRQLSGQLFGAETRRHDRSVGYVARYALIGWAIDHDFTLTRSRSEFPLRDTTGGYGESLYVRSISATIGRNIGTRIVAKATGRVSLSSFRYFLIGQFRTPPIDHDQYIQNYRMEGLYTQSERFNSAVVLEVTRTLFINLPSSSTAANNEDRTYRSEWRWSYRLLRGLTVNQRNSISADYLLYNFLPQNNRLSLSYGTNTALNAVLSPRLTLDVTHNSLVQPSGTFVRQFDGFEAFGESDQSQNYTLSSRISYTPSPLLSLVLEPNYQATNRNSFQNGERAPSRKGRTLNFSGGASVNLPLGARGRLTGDIRRTYRADRSITYTTGVPQPTPRSETDYWNGTLQLSWALQ